MPRYKGALFHVCRPGPFPETPETPWLKKFVIALRVPIHDLGVVRAIVAHAEADGLGARLRTFHALLVDVEEHLPNGARHVK